MSKLPAACSALLACLLFGSVCAGDQPERGLWPQFLGPTADSQAADAQLPLRWSEQQHIVWKTPIHDLGWSSPVIWKDRLWMTTATADGKRMYVVCVDAATGQIVLDQLLWEIAEPRFRHAMNSYASPTPALDAEHVYVSFGSYGTACLDAETGHVLWQRRDLECDHFRGPGSSPILFDNLLIQHYDGADLKYVVALDKRTGETVWKVDRDIDYGTDNGDFHKAYCTPLVIWVDGQPQLISPASKAAIAYDPYTGKELWRITYNGFSATARPLYTGQLVLINSGFSKAELFAVQPTGHGNVTDSHIVWHQTRSIGSKPSEVLVGDLLFVVADNGVASCLDVKTGQPVWTERLPGEYSSSPLHASGRIYFFNQDGTATVVAADRQFQKLAENQLDDGCMASPAVIGNDLIVRTKTHLYRIGEQIPQ